MARSGDPQAEAGPAMRTVLEAEAAAIKAVEAARRQAADAVDAAVARARSLEALAQERGDRIRASSPGAQQDIRERFRLEAAGRLSELGADWNVDAAAVDRVISELAQRLTGGA